MYELPVSLRRQGGKAGRNLLTGMAALAAIGFIVIPLLRMASTAQALPMYSAREGRTCDNCHLSPNNWQNPSLAQRKCTMSCVACHYDPAGGGLRNASGRFFGRSTIPMIATSPRPTQDWDREPFPGFGRRDHATTYNDSLPQGPKTFEEARDWPEAPQDTFAKGSPLGSSPYAFFDGRYGRLNADPVIRIGWDVRVAALISSSTIAFPMQADLGAALHPVHHFTAVANVGARGRVTGLSDTIDDPSTPALREAYVLLHEAPFQSYVKGGRFSPQFGVRLDDHTALTRELFVMDVSLLESRVVGVEVGANPNYPFVALSWFRSAPNNERLDSFNIFENLTGYGYAANLGWRGEGWSLGTGGILRERPVEDGGDARSVSLFGSLNPWKWNSNVPLTWHGEVVYGERTRESGRTTEVAAAYQELDWRLGNGVDLFVVQDWGDPDREVINDESLRFSGGAKLTPIPGITLDGRLRYLAPSGDPSGVDGFIQLHLWN
jgi:hypothetical protein